MMTFPGLSGPKVQEFEHQREAAKAMVSAIVIQRLETAGGDSGFSQEAQDLKNQLMTIDSKEIEEV